MYLNCFIERKSGLMAIKRKVKKIKGRKQGNCFGTRNATLHRKSSGD